ncbi:caspase, EACC1-associated type [[Kitasatospora] papulosa]|uniref:caspase, EACC1-associated type n=1 Tax=[Kitasatospora] papulosa TaxID=1464011 RepID=UPI0036BE82F0
MALAMCRWAGEDFDPKRWDDLVLAAADEKRAANAMADLSGGATGKLTPDAYGFVTPEALGGVDNYRMLCEVAGLDVVPGGYGLLFAEDGDGRRVTLATRDLDYARYLAAAAAVPGMLSNAEIQPVKFSIRRGGWPEDWHTDHARFNVQVISDGAVEFGAWLYHELTKAGISQATLAERLGVPRSAVSGWVRGSIIPEQNIQLGVMQALFDLGADPGISVFSGVSEDQFDCWRNGAAVLIGVSTYEDMPSVPAIDNNLASMEKVLVERLGIPAGKIRTVGNPTTSVEIHDHIEAAIESIDPALGGLFIYYAGHGWTNPKNARLLLGLPGSRRRHSYSAWEFDRLREQLADSSVGTRILVLDSCYSGAALDVLAADLSSSVAIAGTYVMTSSTATNASMAPEGERYTTFTGVLIESLDSGIPGAGGVIYADTLFRHLEKELGSRGFPVPCRQVGHDGDLIPLTCNPWKDRK